MEAINAAIASSPMETPIATPSFILVAADWGTGEVMGRLVETAGPFVEVGSLTIWLESLLEGIMVIAEDEFTIAEGTIFI